jgi:hypothetical protein
VSFGELDRHQWHLLPRREEEERERGEKEKEERGLRLAHRVHSKIGSTVRGAAPMSQVHIFFSFRFKSLFIFMHGLGA